MENPKTFKCDLGGEKHQDHESVRGSVGIYTSDGSAVFSDVCDECADELARMIQEIFPKANARMQSDKLKAVMAEEDAVENAREMGRI